MTEDTHTRLSTLEQLTAQHERRITAHGKDIDELRSLAVSHRADATRHDEIIARIEERLRELSDKMDTLLLKPADRWETLTKTVLTVVVTAVITYFLSRMGLK